MAIHNYTYNYNNDCGMGSMNFGQGLLCGVLGSLTGGMGMNGSIFSMMGGGLGNMYGSPASFFGMGGYGCCGGGYGGYSDSYYASMAGMSVANVVLGGIFSAIGSIKSAPSNDEQMTKLETSAKSYLSTINECMSTKVTLSSFVETKQASDYLPAGNKYDKSIASANSAIKKCESEVEALKASKNDYTKPKKEDYKSDTEFNTAMEKYNKIIADIDAKITEKNASMAEDGTLGKSLNTAKDAKQAKLNAIDEAITALKPLSKEYKELEAIENKKQEKIEQKQQAKAQKEIDKQNEKGKEALDDFVSGKIDKNKAKQRIQKISNIDIQNDYLKKLNEAIAKKENNSQTKDLGIGFAPRTNIKDRDIA